MLAFGFGAGLLPKAPGTWGTLVAVPLYFLLVQLHWAWYLGACLALFVAGIWAAGQAGRYLGVHDHPGIVIDEIVGYLITMLAAIDSGGWWWVGFVLFRGFDILKPWPIGQLDRQLTGGVGVMLDDVVAGVFAALCLFGCRVLFGA